MRKFNVTYQVLGFVSVEIEAEDKDGAIEQAHQRAEDTWDFESLGSVDNVQIANLQEVGRLPHGR